MKVKTSELTGAALDWAVAKCEGHQWRCPWMLEREGFCAWHHYEAAWGNPTPKYSTDWAQGGPIIDRERITLRVSTMSGTDWVAFYDVPGEYHAKVRQKGTTALIAAMRCYVASKLGDEVDVPEELVS